MTLSLPDELVRRAEVLAAQEDTSLSALVASLLDQALGRTDDGDRWAEEEAVMASGPLVVGAVTWSRDDLHRR